MSLRDEMPTVAAFVDDMRTAFGADEFNGWMLGRDGGEFWASENGHEWGERPQLGSQVMGVEAYLRLGQPLFPEPEVETPVKRKGAKP